MSVDINLSFAIDKHRKYDTRFPTDTLANFFDGISQGDINDSDLYNLDYDLDYLFKLTIERPEEIMSYLYQASLKSGKIHDMPILIITGCGYKEELPIHESHMGIKIYPRQTELIKKIFNLDELIFKNIEVNHTAKNIALCLDISEVKVTVWAGGGVYVSTGSNSDYYPTLSDFDFQYRKDVCEKDKSIFLDKSIVETIKSYLSLERLDIEAIGVDVIDHKIILYPTFSDNTPTPKRWKRYTKDDEITSS